MCRRILHIGLTGGLALVVAVAPWPVRAQPAAGTIYGVNDGMLDVEQYTFEDGELKRIERSYAATFGTLAVPERRDDPDSRTIGLPFVRVHALEDDPDEPVFWLDGGPGQTNLSSFDFDYLIRRHDHVMIGYRGVDGSVNLDCPEVTDVLRSADDVLTDRTLDRVGVAYRSCWDRLRDARIDVNGYTTVEVVEDLEAARRALGYDRVHLVGESYGTRLAYLYGVMHPESIGRAVLVGANPPGGFVWDPATYDSLLARYAALWNADAKARARTNDLVQALRSVDRAMPEKWMFLPIHAGNVRASANAMLFETESAAMLFDAYVSAANGDASGLWLISAVAPYVFPTIVNWGDNASKAVSADYDSTRDYRTELVPEGSIMGAPLGRFLWGPVRYWPIRPIPERYRRPQPSSVPTLIVNGDLDFSTPAVNTERDLMPYLSDGTHVILAQAGHIGDLWTAVPEVTRRMVTSFVETGVADTTGMRTRPVRFEVSWGYPTLAKLVLAGVAFVLLLVAIGLAWTGRVLWRRRAM